MAISRQPPKIVCGGLFIRRKPLKVKLCAGNPESVSAMIAAVGPGTALTSIPASIVAFSQQVTRI